MVTDEMLVEFESCMVVTGGDLVHHPGALEVGEVAVHRTLGEAATVLQQLWHAGGMPDAQ